jgi:hypothetical protein
MTSISENKMRRRRSENAVAPAPICATDFTTRLQKGGALLADMRLMVSVWSDDLEGDDALRMLTRALPKTTPTRVRDTFKRAFRPRFLHGSPPQAWRLARVLEDLRADISVIRAIHYWITARAEVPLYEFVTDVIYAKSRSTARDVRVDDAISWLDMRLQDAGKSWTPTVKRKVARGMLAALRDFGILEGRVRKRIASAGLPPEAFALIAFCMHDQGIGGRGLVQHTDWRLFLLGETGVAHIFLECHQRHWLRFETVGDLCRIEFPTTSFKDYAHDILG